MSELVERLYPMPDLRRTPLSTIRWWESRRLFYNRIVGTAGLVTLGGVVLLHPNPGMMAVEGPMIAAVYGIVANLFYSAGWGTELLARAVWGRQAPDMGPLLFSQGLIFSVGLTLLPLVVMVMLRVVMLVLAVLGIG
jgi:hypothetical protein